MDLRFCFKQHSLAQWLFKVNKMVTIVSYTTKFCRLLIKNLITPWLLMLVRGKKLCLNLSFAKCLFMTGCCSHFSKMLCMGQVTNFHQNHLVGLIP